MSLYKKVTQNRETIVYTYCYIQKENNIEYNNSNFIQYVQYCFTGCSSTLHPPAHMMDRLIFPVAGYGQCLLCWTDHKSCTHNGTFPWCVASLGALLFPPAP